MTPEKWAELRDYADRVLVTVRLADDPIDEAGEDWVIVSAGAAWSRDWLVTELESIALDGDTRGQSTPADYHVDIHERRLSWGADVSVFEVFLTLAAWAGTSAAWDATKGIAQKMYARLSAGDAPTRLILTDQEAVERATWTIALRYDERRRELEVHSVEVGAGAATVVLNSETWTYECRLEVVAGDIITAARVKRTRR